jgi:hypothetical protein
LGQESPPSSSWDPTVFLLIYRKMVSALLILSWQLHHLGHPVFGRPKSHFSFLLTLSRDLRDFTIQSNIWQIIALSISEFRVSYKIQLSMIS